MDVGGWVTQLRKGIAEYIVMLALRDREAYGYEILQSLVEVRHLDLGESTVYPLLSRLAREGSLSIRLADSPAGPPRRYYRLTPSGMKRLREMEQYWKEFTHSIANINGEGRKRHE
jgi:PadR family transcriptional regulator, regulatory protein PadR